jgi:hypothetical protein
VAWAHPAARHVPLAAGTLAIVLAGAIVAAYYYPIHLRHQTKVLLISVAYYLLAVLVPPPLAALTAGLGALGGEVFRRRASGAYPSDVLSQPLVLAPIAGEPPRQVLAATLREAALPEGVQYVVGIVGADAALRHLWTLGLLVVPCALVYAACNSACGSVGHRRG